MRAPRRADASSENSKPAGSRLERPAQALPELWRWRDLLLFISFVFIVLPVSYLVAMSAYLMLKPATGFRAWGAALGESPFFLLAFQSAFYGFLLGFIHFLVVVYYRQTFWTALKWRKPATRQTVYFLLGGTLLALATRFAPPLLPEKQSFPLERLFTSTAAAYAIGAFAILVAPFMEELIFRGVIFSILERRGSVWFAVVGTALLFAVLHIPEYWEAWHHVLMVVVVGFVFSLARGVTGSLTPSFLLHLAYNASQITTLFFETHGFRNLHAFILG